MKFVKLVGLCLLIVLFAGWRNDYVNQSTEKSASASISTTSGYLYGITISTDATNAVAIDIYDNTAASGTKLIQTMTITTSATDRVTSIGFNPPVEYRTGLYVSVTCAGTVGYMVYYRNT